MINKNKIVAVALSGGVDSLASGHLLKQKYKHIFGIHFTTGYEREIIDLSLIEKQLGFPVTRIDLSEEFEKKVVTYFIDTYLHGKTPNPCMICNKFIKFGALLNHAMDMGADYIATGHYANIVKPVEFRECGGTGTINKHNRKCYLEKGDDPLKDQSYFLAMLSEAQLQKIIFPLARMNKKEVKKFVKAENLMPVHKSESQDICFIHDNDFAEFIQKKEKLDPLPGDIVDMDDNIVGTHKGLHQFTIGQRRGINCPAEEAYYVQSIDMKNNLLKVCFKKDLLKKSLRFTDFVWNGEDNLQISDQTIVFRDILTKIRYSHKGGLSTLHLNKNGGEVVFDELQNAVTPGQAAVFYKARRVLGAGIIQ